MEGSRGECTSDEEGRSAKERERRERDVALLMLPQETKGKAE